jgi:hypothetical protein
MLVECSHIGILQEIYFRAGIWLRFLFS